MKLKDFRQKRKGDITWNKKETMQIIIKADGTARTTTLEGYYATDVELPTTSDEGVSFDEGQTKAVNALLTADRTTLLTELRESELLEDEKDCENCNDCESMMSCPRKESHNKLARAIKAHLDELIKPTN